MPVPSALKSWRCKARFESYVRRLGVQSQCLNRFAQAFDARFARLPDWIVLSKMDCRCLKMLLSKTVAQIIATDLCYRYHPGAVWLGALALAAAAVLIYWAGWASRESQEGADTGFASEMTGDLPAFEEVVRLHANHLPADVRMGTPKTVSSYLEGKVGFAVSPATFNSQDIRLVGARASSLKGKAGRGSLL